MSSDARPLPLAVMLTSNFGVYNVQAGSAGKILEILRS